MQWNKCTLSKMLFTRRKQNALYSDWLRQYTYPSTKILSVGQDETQLRLTRREMEMGGLLVLLMKSLLRTTLLKGALERRAKNLYNCKNQTDCEQRRTLHMMQLCHGKNMSIITDLPIQGLDELLYYCCCHANKSSIKMWLTLTRSLR